MSLFTAFFLALTISMLMVPPLIRFSSALRLVDEPGPRKIHGHGIPRSGGIAIVVGALVPIAIWLQPDNQLLALLIGGGIIFLFGLLDDRTELDYRLKFFGQGLAAVVAMQGGLLIEYVPFFDDQPLPGWLSNPLTAIFLIGVTNAINLSDGLDGLAGGTALITLAAIAWLAADVGGYNLALIALAVMGGICGFLRYNNHPAVVFMGDTGSQFLGFVTGGLAILLTQDIFTALPHSLVLLLLGMPILDTAVVMVWRIRRGRSPFHADKSHFHHRLLSFGFHHYEAVSAIYLAQALLVGTALLARYQSELAVVLIYLVFSVVVIGFFRWARVSEWRLHAAKEQGGYVERRNLLLRRWEWLPRVSASVLEYGLALLLVASAFAPVTVSPGHGVASALIAAVLLLTLLVRLPFSEGLKRAGVYMAGVSAVYAFVQEPRLAWALEWVVNVYVLGVAALLMLAIRLTRRDEFQATPLDLLILFFLVVVLLVSAFSDDVPAEYNLGETAIRLAVIFYGSEFLHGKGVRHYRVLPTAALLAVAILGVRALW